MSEDKTGSYGVEVQSSLDEVQKMVVSDDDIESVNSIRHLENKIDELTSLVSKLLLSQTVLNDRVAALEKNSSGGELADRNFLSKEALSTLQKPKLSPHIVDDEGKLYPKFIKGEVNPKGGFYTVNHGEKVFVLNGKTNKDGKFGYVLDETKCYIRVRMMDDDVEGKGVLRIKSRVRRSCEDT